MTAGADSGTGRARRRFPAMFAARPGRLAVASLAVVAAAIIGVQLGQSAISGINPVHFQGPLAPQAITPPPEPAPYDPYGQQYVWSMAPPALPADCGPDCDSTRAQRAMRLALDESAGRDPSLPPWRDATPATQLQPWAPGAVPNDRTFERYMHYPVDREQAEHPLPQQAAPASAAPAEALRVPSAQPAVAEPAPAQPVVQN